MVEEEWERRNGPERRGRQLLTGKGGMAGKGRELRGVADGKIRLTLTSPGLPGWRGLLGMAVESHLELTVAAEGEGEVSA